MTRYAVYFTPARASPLADFGASVLGYCSASGREVAFPDSPFHRRETALAWTEEPRRYGFHGTLKAPFALADGCDRASVLTAARDLAARCAPFTVPRLAVRPLSRFVALVPAEASVSLAELAAACVTTFEPLRAPLTAADLSRRLAAPLSDRQRQQLDRWGYPYVFEDFRFHMTLTGPLPLEALQEAAADLAQLYAPIDAPMTVDAISVLEQPDRTARFRLVERVAFG